MDQKYVYGISLQEQARIVCEVDAYPPATEFLWTFNNTGKTNNFPTDSHKDLSERTISTLLYTPTNEMDYGTLICLASNTIGQQKNACVFRTIPVGKYLTKNNHCIRMFCVQKTMNSAYDFGLLLFSLLLSTNVA